MERLEFPNASPDLNIIEHVWNEVNIRVHNYPRHIDYYNQNTLWEAIELEFYNIPQSYIVHLYQSMPNRIKEVIQAKGGFTRF